MNRVRLFQNIRWQFVRKSEEQIFNTLLMFKTDLEHNWVKEILNYSNPHTRGTPLPWSEQVHFSIVSDLKSNWPEIRKVLMDSDITARFKRASLIRICSIGMQPVTNFLICCGFTELLFSGAEVTTFIKYFNLPKNTNFYLIENMLESDAKRRNVSSLEFQFNVLMDNNILNEKSVLSFIVGKEQ